MRMKYSIHPKETKGTYSSLIHPQFDLINSGNMSLVTTCNKGFSFIGNFVVANPNTRFSRMLLKKLK